MWPILLLIWSLRSPSLWAGVEREYCLGQVLPGGSKYPNMEVFGPNHDTAILGQLDHQGSSLECLLDQLCLASYV